MISSTIRSALNMVAILRLAQQGPHTAASLVEALGRAGLTLDPKALHAMLRRLSAEGYLACSYHIEPGHPGVRRYWSTRRGTMAADHFRGAMAALSGPLPVQPDPEGSPDGRSAPEAL